MRTSVVVGNTLTKLRRRNGISAYEFSRNWMLKTPGYLAYTKSSGAEPSFECLKNIRKKALQEQKVWLRYIERNRQKEPLLYIQRVEETANFYARIAEDVEKAMLS